MSKNKDREMKFVSNTNKGQQYYDVMDKWHSIKHIKVEGKKVPFRVVIELEKPSAKDSSKLEVEVK